MRRDRRQSGAADNSAAGPICPAALVLPFQSCCASSLPLLPHILLLTARKGSSKNSRTLTGSLTKTQPHGLVLLYAETAQPHSEVLRQPTFCGNLMKYFEDNVCLEFHLDLVGAGVASLVEAIGGKGESEANGD